MKTQNTFCLDLLFCAVKVPLLFLKLSFASRKPNGGHTSCDLCPVTYNCHVC